MIHFQSPVDSLGQLDAETAANLIAAAADVALVIEESGRILDVSINNADLARQLDGPASLIGRLWAETVSSETRPKIETLMKDAASHAVSAPRQFNQNAAGGDSVPILYTCIRLATGRMIALGRDLRQLAQMQQRLIEAQQSLERDYARLQQVEMRYRLLFERAGEPLLIVDAANSRVLDANPAALQLADAKVGRRAIGRTVRELFDLDSGGQIESLFASVRAAGRADDVEVRLATDARQVRVSASLLRQEGATLLLVRIMPADFEHAAFALPHEKSRLLKIAEHAPDAIVVTDPNGEILTTNAAFLELAHLSTVDQVRGEPLDRWLGRPGVDLGVLIQNLKRHGSVRLFGSTVQADFGTPTAVEVSAVSVMNGEQPCFGFAIRNVSRRLTGDSRAGGELPRSIEQLKELIGRVPLKDLVRETTDTIERIYIEAALELTNDNRASAAEMLGLSRQSLYVKLRRHGLADFPTPEETES